MRKKKILKIFFMKTNKGHNTYGDTETKVCQGGIWQWAGGEEHTREP